MVVFLMCFRLSIVALGAKREGAKPTRPSSRAKQSLLDARSDFFTNRMVTALTRDAAGRCWVGTEQDGVWVIESDGESNTLQQFTVTDGLGDNSVYALLCDGAGRTWVGHLNHGVSVYNGESWSNYGVDRGPLGERVFAMAASPVDGDIWIGTSAGLSRYRQQSHIWSYYTRASGLPSDQIQALAFGSDGTIYVGTQCEGLAIGSPQDNYREWEKVRAPYLFPGGTTIPLAPSGKGLPSNLINCIFVSKSDVVWVGTTTGLAWSQDKGASWCYLRGGDYVNKAEGLYVQGTSKAVPVSTNNVQKLLPGDNVTCVSADSQGVLWVGTTTGLAHVQKGGSFRTFEPEGKRWKLLSCILAMQPDAEGMQVCCYGTGLFNLSTKASVSGATNKLSGTEGYAGTGTVASLPAPAAAPSEAQLTALARGTRAFTQQGNGSCATYLCDDWSTQGDWVGRYGTKRALLCSMNAPRCDHEFIRDSRYCIKGRLGPHADDGDALRHWIQKIVTDSRESLYSPQIGIRRHAEWDDHGESYPRSFEGPDMWVSVTVPEGMQKLSLYFSNSNGQNGRGRFRDYLLEIRRCKSTEAGPDASVVRLTTSALSQIDKMIRQPPLVQARVQSFHGGVYKSFAIKGPGTYLVRISKNNSFNAICSGIFIDGLGSSAEPDMELPDLYLGHVAYRPQQIEGNIEEMSSNGPLQAAVDLWTAVDKAMDFGGVEKVQYGKLFAYRAAREAGPPPGLLANWEWTLKIWDDAERVRFTDTMARAWADVQEMRPYLKTREWCPCSPGVIAQKEADLKEMNEALTADGAE